MHTCQAHFESKKTERLRQLSEQCQQAIVQYNKALECPESINDGMRRQVLYDFYENTSLDVLRIPLGIHHCDHDPCKPASTLAFVVDDTDENNNDTIELTIDNDIPVMELDVRIDCEKANQEYMLKTCTLVQIHGKVIPDTVKLVTDITKEIYMNRLKAKCLQHNAVLWTTEPVSRMESTKLQRARLNKKSTKWPTIRMIIAMEKLKLLAVQF
ncbi:hypothetical protein RFI_07800 [Reticulomyxa filosa]|uniref:Uncharacterized protein n=1 Tax=Reticulomyxa filosa TaxID=46433 RepID=X6NTL4_RETFI|nr:hypothetical protein RFI_07800 [Reticulomyxa filosa]|eukprot:ETO29321.1 hypothetical protein RFI_07800 [Reticulomyxa filosa]